VSDKPDHDTDTGDESGHDNRSDDRNETPSQRMDRNWDELLQELRVAQTGVQILTGFLLTLPFQQRFEKLTEFQKGLYLVAFVLSSTATVVIVAPVGFHRAMFRHRQKAALVRWADRLARAGLTILAGAVSTVALLVFDVVVNLTVGIIAGLCGLLMFALLWLVLPVAVRRRNMRS
jgi:hypothetical protein